MKEGSTPLYDRPSTAEKVTEYSTAHSTALPAHIPAYHAAASASRGDSHMLSSNFQSQLHVFLAHAIGAKRVLEIGVYLGYSAMLWSHATGPDGRVTGLEISPDLARTARDALAAHNIDNVDIVVGPAAETLSKLDIDVPYDLVFLDADKAGYNGYLDIMLSASQPGQTRRMLRPGALIIADNVLREGHVADGDLEYPADRTRESWDEHIAAVRGFNDRCVAEARLETFVLPLWDGVGIMRLRD